MEIVLNQLAERHGTMQGISTVAPMITMQGNSMEHIISIVVFEGIASSMHHRDGWWR